MRPCTRVDEMKPRPLCSSAATSPSVCASSAPRRKKQTMPSEGGAASSSDSLASIRPARELGEVERVVDRGAERVDAERAQREPELERARRCASAGCRGRRSSPRRPRPPRRAGSRTCISNARRSARAVAHEQAAALVRLVEPLVRVERDRVGEREPAERVAAALGQHGEAAVGRVDVEPDAALAAERGELVERIDRAGARRAAVRDDEERQPSRGLVGRRSRPRASPGRAAGRRRPAARAAGRAGSRACAPRAPIE